jgi:hypothetical protein
MNEKFNFVIARYRDEHSNQLRVFTIHNNEVQWGTQEEAENLCAYVNTFDVIKKRFFIVAVGKKCK